ncbi:MAG: cyclic nucleotide-binding domain-containing protein [Endomicrobiales bacterium]|jgi:CRP-like cAMP-binding protein
MELTEQDRVWAQETLEKSGLFNGCTDRELAELFNGLDKQQYHAESSILLQGEISSRLCLIHAGMVKVIVRKGKEKTKVAELGAGHYFGEISLLTPRAATATIKAGSGCEIFFLPGDIVQSLVKRNPALAEKLNKKIEERLQSQHVINDHEHC